jgi:cholesterol transport system auxiliary component
MKRRALLGGAAATLAGCSVLPERPYQERRQWPLDVRRPTSAVAAPHAPVLLLRALRAGPGLDTRGLRTRLADGAERIDNWEEWAVPPPQGVEECLRQWLAASGLFSAVVMPGSQAIAEFVLEGELVAFVGDQPAGVARVGLSLVLLRPTGTGRYLPVLQRGLTGQAPLTATGGPALAASMQAALAALLTTVEATLAPSV